jgi:hypothetical protein
MDEVYFIMTIWYLLSRFGILYRVKSGNPAFKRNYSLMRLRCLCLPDLHRPIVADLQMDFYLDTEIYFHPKTVSKFQEIVQWLSHD